MWPRVVEIMLGCWMAMSPFIFQHSASRTSWWATDLGSAAAIWVLSGLSFWRPARYAHWWLILLGCYLIAFGWLSAEYPYADLRAPDYPPAIQNHVLVGLLLLMLAIIPGQATQPPEVWRSRSALTRI
jgi:hypothetical protein